MIDIASGEVEDREPTPEEQGKRASRVARGKISGPKGGKARALKLVLVGNLIWLAVDRESGDAVVQ